MNKQGKTQKRRSSGLRSIAYFGFAAAGVLIIIMIWAASRPSSSLNSAESVPPYFASAEAARPFPTILPAVDFRSYPAVQRAYAVAAQIPGVLAQQPCYCHCDRMGHRSLLDCYASQHAAVCGVCLMEAQFSQQMTQQGQDPATIRQEIINGQWRNVQLNGPLP